MFQRILVPLDGSQCAERAIPVAARLARASGGSVILVQALSLDIDLYLVPQPTLIEMAVDAERACAEKYLRGVATSVTLDGVPTETVALAHQREVFGHRWTR
jgi:nucleotide-binding universal stress UspA family protein